MWCGVVYSLMFYSTFTGELHAFDMDEDAIAAGKVLASQDKRFHIHYSPFSAMFQVLTQLRVAKGSSPEGNFVDGVLIDIGISSPQLDGSRGFRPEDTYDSPLDMRFDQRPHVESALQFVQRVGRHQLASCIEHYGGEHPLAARRIADAIALAKANGSLPTRTAAFGALVANAKGHEYQAMHPAKMTFQALRIQVNQEYDELRGGLEASMKLLKDGGKTAVLTWKHTECAILVDHARKHEVKERREERASIRSRSVCHSENVPMVLFLSNFTTTLGHAQVAYVSSFALSLSFH